MAEPKIEFQAADDGWYEVTVEIIRGCELKVHYQDFGDEFDEVLSMDDFESRIARSRFRSASTQLQDQNCGQLGRDTNICASCATDGGDLTHFDAVVKKVCKSQHRLVNGEELCTCTFKVLWKAGPRAHKITSVFCENICLLTKGSIKSHPVIKDFVKLVETKKEGRKGEKEKTMLTPTNCQTRSTELIVEEKLACKVQFPGRNLPKRKRTDMKGRNTPKYKDKQGEPVMSENNRVVASDLQSNHINSKGKAKNISDICKNETTVNTPMGRIEAALPSTNQVSREMEIKTDDKLKRNPSLNSMTVNLKIVASPSREMEKKTNGRLKLTLDLNSFPLDLETKHLDAPTTTVGLHSSTSIESMRSCQSGWLEEDDCDTLQNENSGYNLVDKGIAGKPVCFTADIKNEGSNLSEDHSLSASVCMKQPTAGLVINNWDGDYNCERVSEQLTVEENQKNKVITDNKLEKTVFPTYFRGEKQQKLRSNTLFSNERHVQDYIQTGEIINASKKPTQHGNDLDATDTLSSSNLTRAHVRHNTSQNTKEPLHCPKNSWDIADQNLGNAEKIGKVVDEYEPLVHNRQTSLPARNQCGTKESQFYYSKVLVLENLEKDISPCDVKKIITSVGYGVDRVCILPSLKFKQSTRGFVWFKDRASLMKALGFLQDDNLFIVSSNGRPWVARIDNGLFEGIFEGLIIESKDSEESSTSSKISLVHKGTEDYEKAKKRKSIYLEFKDYETRLHRRLEFEENNI